MIIVLQKIKREKKESVNTRNKTKGAGNRKIMMFTAENGGEHARGDEGARSFIFPVKTL